MNICHLVHNQLRVTLILFPHAELYDYCLNEGYADKNLIAKWKKVRESYYHHIGNKEQKDIAIGCHWRCC